MFTLGASSTTIAAASATVKLQTVTTSIPSVLQTQTIKFVTAGSNALSGNPGYDLGKTLWLGYELASTITLVTSLGFSDSSGYCASSTNTASLRTTSIKYGTNMMVSCMLSTSSSLSSYCDGTVPDALTALGNILRVGQFGNVNTGDLTVLSRREHMDRIG